MSGNTTNAKVVIAEFIIKDGMIRQFLEIADEHARITLANEPGCRQFDVDQQGDNKVILYEVYDDEGAFAHHRTQTQLQRFRAATANMVEERNVRELVRISNGRVRNRGKILVAVSSLKQRTHLLEPLASEGYEIEFANRDHTLTQAELIANLPGVVATIAASEPYNATVFAAAPELKVVSRLGVGYDQIDVDAATRAHVAIAMAFGANHDAVADHAFALISTVCHRILRYDSMVKAGAWVPLFHHNLSGSTVGIIGFGRIGRALAKRCKGFNMRVLATDPAMDVDTLSRLGCELVPFEELLARSDFVSVHTPWDKTTNKMINAKALSLMKPTAFLVNTARGGIVDETALINALMNKEIAGAGLDVFASEPLSESPLATMDNVVLSPHIAGVSEEAVRSMAMRAVENTLSILDGRDPGAGYVLNPEVLNQEL